MAGPARTAAYHRFSAPREVIACTVASGLGKRFVQAALRHMHKPAKAMPVHHRLVRE